MHFPILIPMIFRLETVNLFDMIDSKITLFPLILLSLSSLEELATGYDWIECI